MRYLLFAILLLAPCALQAQDFTGQWSIDLRSSADKAANVECGTATFQLVQTSDRIAGNYSYATPRCGRVDDGLSESVKGIVIAPGKAVLVVTSGRNGAIAFGVAALLPDKRMAWDLTDYVSQGEPRGDDLIIRHGELAREK